MSMPRGYATRAAGAADEAAIERLLAACDAAEPEPSYRGLAAEIRGAAGDGDQRRAGEALVVTDSGGQVVACTSVRLPDYPRPVARARLAGAVHPRHRGRGIGGALLAWSEREAQNLFGARRETRPRSLRITFGGARNDARCLYARHGFGVHEMALQLRRDLSASAVALAPVVPVAPAIPLPAGFTAAAWSPQSRELFYAAHAASREAGLEDHLPTSEAWCADVAADASLRPDLSLVVMDGHRPCAFVLSEVVARDGRAVGWIWLLGVAPDCRRRGLATALLSHVLDAFRREGLPEAGLWVDEANVAARAVYHPLEFHEHSRLTTYAKWVGAGTTQSTAQGTT